MKLEMEVFFLFIVFAIAKGLDFVGLKFRLIGGKVR